MKKTFHSIYTPFMRYRVFLLSLIIILQTISALSQNNNYPLVHTPETVNINYKVPTDIITDEEAIPISFSAVPADEEIYKVHFFEEPLIPSNAMLKAEENRDLVYALIAYSQRKNADDFTSITHFLEAYPKSRWQGALSANLGLVYRRTGYYNKALDAWQQSWILLKNSNEGRVKVLADRVLSELLLLDAWVGRMTTIDSLLSQTKDRVIEGPAAARVASVRGALWTMKNRQGLSFKCGPYALNYLYALHDSTKPFSERMMNVQSTPAGFSLAELLTFSKRIGLRYQMAFRTPGAQVICKAVVHWKLDHYSTLVKEENGYYKCQDATAGTTYGQEFWLTPAAFDSSASGYFLVPEGPLPKGWRRVDNHEGRGIFGKGKAGPDPGKDLCTFDKQLPEVCGTPTPMAQSNVHAAAVSLHIYDRPLFYSSPVGPSLEWIIDYHQRDTYQPANFTYSNMGPKWTYRLQSYVQDDPNNPMANTDVYEMGGGVKTFILYDTTTKSYAPERQTNDVLVRTCPNCYELRHPDGSKDVYRQNDGNTSVGRKIFLTQRINPAGDSLIISYDAALRIKAVRDALGQVTTFEYKNADTFKITKVIDPFGRSASFQYNASGRLSQIVDMVGIVSSFQYDSDDFITSMITPYGKTSFTRMDSANVRVIETSYPMNEKERVEFRENAPGINMTEAKVPKGMYDSMAFINDYMTYRNTFYWDKKAMKTAPGIYTQAKILHWLHGSSVIDEDGSVAPILESEKEPLENRVWYAYQGQTVSILTNEEMQGKAMYIGRVLDNDSTQLYQHGYNTLGRDTSFIDPAGRTFKYSYDSNKVDLLEVRQKRGSTNELLAKFTYNSQHLPLTSKNASGLTTSYTYNNAGQLLTIKNPKKEVTTLDYDSKGYLKSITGAVLGFVVRFAYDVFGRVKTITDPEGYTITTDYDFLDRPTVITYPDSTYEQIVYDRLDVVHKRDRLGRWSHVIYDSLDRASARIDALGRVTQFIWCSCGSLSEIIDPLKNVTSLTRDLQGRLLIKTFADGKSITYDYENTTSRVKQVTDAKGQVMTYSYFTDDNLKQVDYQNSMVATASVAYTYDTSYNRILSMADGTGITTYSYKKINSGLGSGKLSSEKGSLINSVINYTYDSLERLVSRSINGIATSLVYDQLGRITSETNALGAFGYAYVDQTPRLKSMTYPNSQNTVYDYFDNNGDEQLKQIWNKNSGGSTLSKFSYEYNKENQITKWTQQSDSTIISYYDISYDLSDQLIAATLKSQSTATIIKRYAYQYDKSGNRTSEQVDNSITSAIFNNLNQMIRRQDNGPVRIKGTVNEPSTVLVKNLTTNDSLYATVDSASNSFEAFIKSKPGADSIQITATDYSGNSSLKKYGFTIGKGENDTLTFDDNGNMVSETNPAVKYEWNAADKLVKITQGNNITEFVYDGFGRRVIEKLNGTITRRWLWCGSDLCEERNAAGGSVTKRFYKQGEQISGTSYYFTKDHLGSVVEMTDASSLMKTRYNYGLYGKRTRALGSVDADFGFTGHYYHASSGLHLTLYREYNGNIGRWISSDPVSISKDYKYVSNNPLRWIDKNGLRQGEAAVAFGVGFRVEMGSNPETCQHSFGLDIIFGTAFNASYSDANPDGPNGLEGVALFSADAKLTRVLSAGVSYEATTNLNQTVTGSLSMGPVEGSRSYSEDANGNVTKSDNVSEGAGEGFYGGFGFRFTTTSPPLHDYRPYNTNVTIGGALSAAPH